MNTPPIKINKDKYLNALLYFFKYCNNEYLGKTKLNKLLYYLDFISYRDRTKTITNDIYLHKSYGPVPENIDEIIAKLKSKGVLNIETIPYKEADKFTFISKKMPDLSKFNAYEIKLLKYICDTFLSWSTKKIVGQTHLEAPWFYSKPYDYVDFKYSSNIDFFTKHGQTAN